MAALSDRVRAFSFSAARLFSMGAHGTAAPFLAVGSHARVPMPGTQKPIMALLYEAIAVTPALARIARAATGAVLGVFGGVVITLSAVVVRARFQHEYLDSVDNLIHWQSAPMVLAPVAGVVFGLAGVNALRASIVGSLGGMVIGAVLGGCVGWLFGAYQEGTWAGGVIGAGIGLTVGGLALGLRAWSRDEGAHLDFPSRLDRPFRRPPR